MTGTLRRVGLACACLTVLCVGCADQRAMTVADGKQDVAVSCIAVFPASSVVNNDGSLSYPEAEQLQKGVQVLDTLLAEQLAGHKDIRFVSRSQIDSLDAALPEKAMARSRAIAEHVSCNTALETKLFRYSERIGGKYTAEKPAAVGFEYRLFTTDTGTILCQGTFEEVQQSVMENLFNFRTASNRGFTWISAHDLLQEGIEEKFDECSYLSSE